MFYTGEPVTEGFRSVRQAGESISVDAGPGRRADRLGRLRGRAVFSGAGGRDPLFLAEDFIPLIEQLHQACPGRPGGR